MVAAVENQNNSQKNNHYVSNRKLSQLQARLLSELALIPVDWQLVPLNGNKQPLGDEWQKRPFTPQQMAEILQSGVTLPIQQIEKKVHPNQIKGYGILTGTSLSRGDEIFYLMALDLDGESAHAKMLLLSDGEELPPTVAFTSGRPGRSQHLFLIPSQYASAIHTKKFRTGVKGDDGLDELLELRFANLQSVLPKSVHPTTGQYHWLTGCAPNEVDLAIAPTWVIEKMQVNQQPQHQHQEIQKRDCNPSSREQWTNIDWAISYLNALQPYRVDDYNDWLVVGMALKSVDESLLAEWENWSRQSSKYKSGECERKWNSFKKNGVGIPTLAHMAKQDGWKSQFQGRSIKPPSGKGFKSNPGLGSGNGQPPINSVSLRDRILEILNLGLSDSQLKETFIGLKKSTEVDLKAIEDLARLLESEVDQESERTEIKKALPNLIEVQNVRLNPHDYLWGDGGLLAQMLQDTAIAMPTAVEFLITTLIPVAGSRIGTSSRIVIKPSAKYTQPAIFKTCIVSESGHKKTPAQQVIIQPLDEMEASEYEIWQATLADYAQEMAAYEQSKNRKGDEPTEKPEQPPPRRRFILQNGSIESRIKIHSENPRGLLIYRDEWSAHITGRNKYRQGKGDDAENELSEFNGGSLSKDVVDSEKCLYLKRSAISRTGTTQPDKLKELMAEHEDVTGEFARWLFCIAECPPAYIDLLGDDTDTGISEALKTLYQRLELLPIQDYLLTQEAKVVFQRYQHQLIDRTLAETHPGLKTAFPKFESYLARFALWLHCVNAALANEQPLALIPGYVMEQACSLCDYYIGQLRLIYALNSPQQQLTGRFLKIKNYVDTKVSGVTLREISTNRSIRGTGKNSAKKALIQVDCQVLVDSGQIKFDGEKYYPATSRHSAVSTTKNRDTSSQSKAFNDLTPLDEDMSVSRVDTALNDVIASISSDCVSMCQDLDLPSESHTHPSGHIPSKEISSVEVRHIDTFDTGFSETVDRVESQACVTPKQVVDTADTDDTQLEQVVDTADTDDTQPEQPPEHLSQNALLKSPLQAQYKIGYRVKITHKLHPLRGSVLEVIGFACSNYIVCQFVSGKNKGEQLPLTRAEIHKLTTARTTNTI